MAADTLQEVLQWDSDIIQFLLRRETIAGLKLLDVEIDTKTNTIMLKVKTQRRKLTRPRARDLKEQLTQQTTRKC